MHTVDRGRGWSKTSGSVDGDPDSFSLLRPLDYGVFLPICRSVCLRSTCLSRGCGLRGRTPTPDEGTTSSLATSPGEFWGHV